MVPALSTSLGEVLAHAAQGVFPDADGGVTVLPQPSPRDAGVLNFTAHAVVFADLDPDWVRGLLPADDLAAPLSPPFLQQLCAATGRRAGTIDMLCVAEALTGEPPVELTAETDNAHPRIQRALNYRGDVRAWRADGGVVLLGRGVAGRWEAAIEVDPAARSRGLGRKLAAAARQLVPDGRPLWAQVAPGNAASVRAFLAAGFVPVGAEVLLAVDGDTARDATISGMSDAEQVTDNRERSRFELSVEGQLAELVYRRRANRLVLVHAEVPEALGGRGIGGRLVQAAVDRAVREGLTIVPLCPFARSWLESHTDAADTVTVDWGPPPDD